jgi:large subunit ribosomal protein L6
MQRQKMYISEIKIPDCIKIKKKNTIVFFYGPFGCTGICLKRIDPQGCGAIFLNENLAAVKIIADSKSYHGVLKKLILNKIQGVTRGFLIYLKILGIGYRAHLEKNTLLLKLGFSHDILYNIPQSIKIFLLDPTLICLFGVDKNQITQIARNLKDLKKPSVYKGKGIRLFDEKIQLKTGKRK